ncbi:MAG: type II toxin-antitoxin system VapC family toxin [Alphaproteobacteria bacterium]|nr:type II toxin-antitoxin system VapC family toxin [Alphaproteobacteria bacterium]MBV9016223.1 type II toxin-antitoxin system VapC family toxin [Alphaproteobacteria bacterium]MBV9150939.1 type II toxin-antitoxin system VapC family toxin [Alphaproteobacteria bacterium]MBV9587038.1 type II toxin-antitoxin system VapC family toxin [Alphaproteobacteria bacterium]MBV9965723.1 type II toxin-antitoxin system VapC family toxin [Alphaproteobacteria bacterium]
MPRYMLDTNICIYVIRNRPAELRHRFDEALAELCISVITLAELCFGAEKSARPPQNRNAVEAFVARLDVLPFSAQAAAHYGQIRAALERAGRPAGVHDMLIGAHARSESMTLVTNNRREFDRMPGLAVENWI